MKVNETLKVFMEFNETLKVFRELNEALLIFLTNHIEGQYNLTKLIFFNETEFFKL